MCWWLFFVTRLFWLYIALFYLATTHLTRLLLQLLLFLLLPPLLLLLLLLHLEIEMFFFFSFWKFSETETMRVWHSICYLSQEISSSITIGLSTIRAFLFTDRKTRGNLFSADSLSTHWTAVNEKILFTLRNIEYKMCESFISIRWFILLYARYSLLWYNDTIYLLSAIFLSNILCITWQL